MKHLPLIISSTLVVTAAIAMLVTWWPAAAVAPPDPAESVAAQEKSTEPEPTPAPPAETEPPAEPDHDYYSYRDRSSDGIGKYYQGREIAQVMGHQAIDWLERDDREAEESPTTAINLIDLAEGETLADIGAGSGYYSSRLAIKYPEAKVIGVDIQPEMVFFLKAKAKKLGLSNLSAQISTIQDIKLPADSINAALMVDAYHEFSHPYEMMSSIVKALKPGGRVYLLEYREEDPTVNIKPLHKMSQAQAKKEMALVGLKWEKTHDDLPWQHFMVFRKP